MLTEDKIELLGSAARAQSSPAPSGDGETQLSILSLAAASYGAKPNEEATVPTGFDPLAVVLFEAIVEGGYLVAAADGVVDANERRVFERIVTLACSGVVLERQVTELVGTLEERLKKDGMDKRVVAVGEQVKKKEHALEVLRISALLAFASDGVSPVEREVLDKLGKAFGLTPPDVEEAIADVKAVLAANAA